jgi:hypothetical protein
MAAGIVPTLGKFWSLYWTTEVLKKICMQTNLYARQYIREPQVVVQQKTNGRKDWVPITVEELEAWIGILFIMGVKKEPQRRNYWQNADEVLRDPIIPRVMSLRRWEAINRCIHLVDNCQVQANPTLPGFDMLAKLRWLLDYFSRRSQELYHPERVITVDEIVVPYKGKYARIIQFMKDKPHRFGLKIWCVCSSLSRFVLKIEVYEGVGTSSGEQGLGYHVTMRLLEGYEGRGHTIVVDNFFASVRLFHDLMVKGFWATGTIKANRVGMPRGMSKADQKASKDDRGNVVIRMHRHRQMCALSWQDAKLVTMISTASDAWKPDVTMMRRNKGQVDR